MSNAVAQSWMLSFYDSVIQIKKLPYLPDLKKGRLYNMTAADIMNRELMLVSAEESSYADIKELVSKSEFSSFPVVNNRGKPRLSVVDQPDVVPHSLFFFAFPSFTLHRIHDSCRHYSPRRAPDHVERAAQSGARRLGRTISCQ